MRKIKRSVAIVLLLCIVGGVLCSSFDVYAAGQVKMQPSKESDGKVVFSADADTVGSITVNDTTYPFWSDDNLSPAVLGSSLEDLGTGYKPDGVPSEYAETILNNHPDIVGVGGNGGDINNYVYRFATTTYGLTQLSTFAASVRNGSPQDAMWTSPYSPDSTYVFTVGNKTVDVSGKSFYQNISDIDGADVWDNVLGMNDKTTYQNSMGMLGGNVTGLKSSDFNQTGTGDTPDASTYSLETYGAMHNLILEFYTYATAYRSYAYGGGGDLAPYKVEKEVANTLATLEQIYKYFDSYFPILGRLWSYSPANEMSLEEMCEDSDGEYSPDGATIKLDSTFGKVLDESTPLGLFYIINSENGIARIDKEAVWNNIETDVGSGQTVSDYIDDMNGVEDGVNKWESELEKDGVLSGASVVLDALSEAVAGVDTEGTAVNTRAVSMSDYITQGMIYSSTFVPMKTNLYSPDTLAQFDQEFREEFYYKYGFMRKALLWDKSGTAAVDFYNANGKCTGTLSVVTLRDLLNTNGNDVALYVDSDFYNAEEAIEEGNNILEQRTIANEGLSNELTEYQAIMDALEALLAEDDIKLSDVLAALHPAATIVSAITRLYRHYENTDDIEAMDAEVSRITKELKDKYNFDLTTIEENDAIEYASMLTNAVNYSKQSKLDEHVLKTGDFSQYSNKTAAMLKQCDEFTYRKIEETEPVNNDNLDTIVLPSSVITSYMDATSSYENRIKKDEEGIVVVNRYTSYDDYTPMLSLSYVSSLYREGNYYSLANLVANDNPVFLASDDLCGIEGAGQWYCNTIINYAFLQNLKSATQIDYTYTVDLDCPLYIDVFGNILTESGIVVIPAACNATLHSASFKNANVAVGLYAIYGKDYYVPVECTGAAKALFPFFTLDKEEGVYIVNGNAVTIGTDSVQYNELSPYDVSTQNAVVAAYESSIKDMSFTNVNWVAMTNIINEVMRGAPIENIDKSAEGLNVTVERNKAAIVAAVKLESLIDSFKGMMQNTLLAIPDFTRMDSMEYLVAFLIKILIAATTAVVIIGVYRDGVSGTLGLRTLWKSLSSIALTFAAVCVIPAVFQLTYYAANKFLLQDEAMRILMLNTEKYQSGVEIGMLETYTPENDNDMAIQLDWISVPWYDQLENMLYGSTLQNLDEVKREAYFQSPIFDNYDVDLHDDGVYVTTESLFNGVSIDYTFNDITATADSKPDGSKVNGMYLYSSNKLQTAGFYSPYYVFLTALVGNVNEYNYYHDSYNYTTKYMSGNRLKTVGLCNAYFTSKSFMELDGDIMHIYEIYDSPKVNTYDHGYLFTLEDKLKFSQSYWYNTIDEEHLDKRVELLNGYARDFIANNKDLLMKVSDETFLKVMALNMAIKYNQLFGIPAANAVEIYNMDSNDLLRLSIVPTDEAILASPMSYSRYVYNFGGEPAVYAAAVLTVIMWVGSFIKPLCTVIVFISVFLSIWVFRVVLRKPSANLLGYLITVLLLCGTNVLHAVILKVSTYLPNMGLSTLGCLLFIIVGQVVYLLLLGYVTGVSLKDWSNLGYTEYDREAKRIRRKLGDKKLAQDNLNGRIPNHENNWDYYNDLVNQHRSRNT